MDKMTVNEVSRLTGVSIRTLQYYDRTGLLPAAGHTDAGYRLYDENSLERLQQILLFKELEFPLAKIKQILDSPGFDRDKALEQQTELLIMRKEQLEKLICLAKDLRKRKKADSVSDFSAFDKHKLKEYQERAAAQWGDTPQYAQYARKNHDDEYTMMQGLLDIFAEFGKMKKNSSDRQTVNRLVEKLKGYITENFYECTDDILLCLADMYVSDPEFRNNIDSAGGEGTAEYVNRAVKSYFDENC